MWLELHSPKVVRAAPWAMDAAWLGFREVLGVFSPKEDLINLSDTKKGTQPKKLLKKIGEVVCTAWQKKNKAFLQKPSFISSVHQVFPMKLQENLHLAWDSLSKKTMEP